MNKPVIFRITTFDATTPYTVTYEYTGNQQFANRLIVRRSTDNVEVYNRQETTFQLQHTIPANSLINGLTYTAEVIVYDNVGTASPPSDRVLFKCISTPTFYINNIEQNAVIRNSSFLLTLTYSQAQGEPLSSFIVNLYDGFGNLIDTSGTLYTVDNLSFLLRNMTDDNQYSVQSTGLTASGMPIRTPRVTFSVNYIAPATWQLLQLENMPEQASIKITSNIILIEGRSNPTPPIYINNQQVDIRGNGHYVIFDEGFNIEDDFMVNLICKDMPYDVFFEMKSTRSTNSILVSKRFGFFGNDLTKKDFFLLVANSGERQYKINSPLMDVLTPNDMIQVVIIKKNNIFNIRVVRD